MFNHKNAIAMKTLVKYYLNIIPIALAIFLAGSSHAQNGNGSYSSYSGSLKDAKTRQDIVFAYITVPNSHIGTVSNSEGEFTLKIGNDVKADEIEISHIGYKKKIVALSSLKTNGNIIFLDPSSIELEEVTVRPIDPRQIVIDALQKIPYNYSESPNMLTGFYRETIKQRREYISISEAVVDIYQSSYRPSGGNDRVKIYKGRKSANVKKADTLTVKLQGGPSVSLLLDIAKHHDYLFMGEDIKSYDFILEDMVTIDNRINYVIGFAQHKYITTPLYYGRLYIDTRNLAITHAQFSLNLDNKDEAAKLFIKRKPAGVKFVPVSTSYLVNYNVQDGVYYLNYARNELTFKANWRKRLFNTTYTINSELAITDRSLDNISRFPYKESFKQTDILNESVEAFNDEDFWGEHNYIKPEESIQEAIIKYGKRLKRQSR